MIPANELRIGNRIQRVSTGSICTVNWGIIKDAENLDTKDYAPIPITPEILDKVGLPLQTETTVTGLRIFANMRMTLVEMATEEECTDFEVSYFPLIMGNPAFLWRKRLNLHQLQNLYFALTAEELKLDQKNIM